MSVPLHLLTGFLGSGKTTFLSRFLESFPDAKKVAVVQNEFAAANIDGAIMDRSRPYHLLEVNNGSVFCVCLLGSFIDSLAKFIKEVQPDLILMEASGLSDTLGVGQVFRAPQLEGLVYLEHVWCLVDPINRAKAIQLRLERQIRSADTVVISKVDLLEESPDQLITEIRSINPGAKILTASYGRIDFSKHGASPLFRKLFDEEALGCIDVDTAVIKSTRSISQNSLQTFLDRHGPECFRYKGFVHLDNGETRLVQGIHDSWTSEAVSNFTGPSELVLIGRFSKDTNLQAEFEMCCSA